MISDYGRELTHMPNDPHPAFPDLHAFWDAYKELDAAYALGAKA